MNYYRYVAMTAQRRSLRVADLAVVSVPDLSTVIGSDFTSEQIQAAEIFLLEVERREKERLAKSELRWQKEGF